MGTFIAAEITAVIFGVERNFGTHQWGYNTISYTKVQPYVSLFIFNKTNRRTNFSKFIFVTKFYMFRAVPLPETCRVSWQK